MNQENKLIDKLNEQDAIRREFRQGVLDRIEFLYSLPWWKRLFPGLIKSEDHLFREAYSVEVLTEE